jgi:hypothetical protein
MRIPAPQIIKFNTSNLRSQMVICFRLLTLSALVHTAPMLLASGPPDSDAYAAVTAHSPDYENKELWPNLTGKERFLAVQWPKGRVMEWAHPGKSGGVRTRNGLDVWDPANWLLDGQPCEEVIFDENTDLVLPASDTPYSFSTHDVPGWTGNAVFRHVTVGENASLGNMGVRFFGNIWIKKGGRIGGGEGNTFVGQDTFYRIDDDHDPDHPEKFALRENDSVYPRDMQFQYLRLEKDTPETSMELLGGFSAQDRVGINRGILIVGEGSRFSNGRNASMIIQEEGTIALLDGSVLMKWCNQIGQFDFAVLGTLQGGLPERPLRRPAFVGLGYQNSTGVRFFDRLPRPEGLHPDNPIEKLEHRTASMGVESTGTLRSFSATPEGLLHFRWAGLDAKDWHTKGDAGYREWVESFSEEQFAYLAQQLDSMPRKVTALFMEGSQVDGVVFNDFLKGGLLLETEQVRDAWKNVHFGSGNDAEGDDLLTVVASAGLSNRVKGTGATYQLPGEKPAAE